jgi:tyrosyl-tRNA synthetase
MLESMNSNRQIPNPQLFTDLDFRGLVKQMTDPSLPQVLSREPITLYVGFDPTSDSLHVGSLLPLLTLRRFQQAGHRVIALVGGATGMIGDPSGKALERSLLSKEQLDKNQMGIARVLSQFLELEGANGAIIENNANWFAGFGYIDFLRDIGKHFTVNHMIAKESVRARLEDREHGISYTEFSYMLLQAYDFYHLFRRYGCRMQMGGSDQWGNITAGLDLIHKMCAAEGTAPEVFGLTHPLVMKSDGTKFGKTEKGAIWLSTDRTSVYQFYQFFIQTADADVSIFLKYFTFLSRDEIERLETVVRREPEKREAQLALAREVTRLVHGDKELALAEKASEALFGGEIKALDSGTLLDVFADAPSTSKSRDALCAGILLVDLLAETGLCGSKGAARKDIAAGGIYLNNDRVTDPAAKLRAEDLIAGSFLVLRKGKKNYHLVSIN